MAAKYETLDGLRGVAAFSVLLFHIESSPRVASGAGYLAVDLFFLMSGFVVAGAYESRLLEGWRVRNFLQVRLHRLWPLYAAGVLLGVAYFMAMPLLHPVAAVVFPNLPVTIVALLGLFFLPQPLRGPAFPFNIASWSLSVEVFGNLIYALLVRILHNRLLVICMAIGLGGLSVAIWRDGNLDGGAGNVAAGYVRFMFSFPLGVWLHRLHVAGRLRVPKVPFWVPLLLAALACSGVVDHGGWSDLLIVTIVFPLILVMSLVHPASQRVARLLARMGAVSYPLYVLHPPLIELAKAILGPRLDAPAIALLAMSIIAVAALAERYYDRPLQRYLRSKSTELFTFAETASEGEKV